MSLKSSGLFFLIISCALFTKAQDSSFSNSRFAIELVGSVSPEGSLTFESARHFHYNENVGIYGEARISYRINSYFEAGLFVGRQKRFYIYFAQDQIGNQVPLFMERYYIPGGLNMRLYISDFFQEKLRLWKKQGRWDVYLQLGIVRLFGHDANDVREQEFSNQGYIVPYFKYPYVEEYGKIYPSYVLGLRYNAGRHFGVFIEGGDGALTTLQIGFRAVF
jgi:hypothetical protein